MGPGCTRRASSQNLTCAFFSEFHHSAASSFGAHCRTRKLVVVVMALEVAVMAVISMWGVARRGGVGLRIAPDVASRCFRAPVPQDKATSRPSVHTGSGSLPLGKLC